MAYKEGELEELHKHLYDILAHTIKVCKALNIRYFINGGSAIGAFYEGSILPWDDDIDICMERAEYDRFLREAPAVLDRGYTLQSPMNEPLTPYYFAKIRKDNTLFITQEEQHLDIHHGIYIDIFPMDRVPDVKFFEWIQRQKVRVLSNAFVAKQIELEGSWLAKALYKVMVAPLPKSFIYKLLVVAQTWFNGWNCRYINIVKMPRDHIERTTVNPPQIVKFGDLQVAAPHDLERYLNWHYPGITRYPSEDKRVNHSPLLLDFNTSTTTTNPKL